MEPYLQLEAELGKWLKNPNVVSCSSGTASLHLALESLNPPLGCEIIVPEFTMIACARAVTLAGCKPVFVDCGPDLLIDVDLIDDVITEKTWGIMPVHIYGRQCAMDSIAAISRKYGLKVIEDCSEAHGGFPVHKNTDAACWSFYRNKIVAGEEGGAIAFKEAINVLTARQLRSLGFTGQHDFLHEPRGHNYRMSNSHAALILNSLKDIKSNLLARSRIEGWYNEEIPNDWRMPARDVCWVYDLRIPGMLTAGQNALIAGLRSYDIAARHAFKPMSEQPEYKKLGNWSFKGLKAYRASREVIYLPVDPRMGHREVIRNVGVLKTVVDSLRDEEPVEDA